MADKWAEFYSPETAANVASFRSTSSIKDQRREQLSQMSRQQQARQVTAVDSDPIAAFLYQFFQPSPVQSADLAPAKPAAKVQPASTDNRPRSTALTPREPLPRPPHDNSKRLSPNHGMNDPSEQITPRGLVGAAMRSRNASALIDPSKVPPIPATIDERMYARRNVASSSGGGGGGSAQTTTYTVKAGDTLSGIAKKLTGNANAYRQIATANGISDPNKLKVGQVLQIGGSSSSSQSPSAPAVKRPTTPPVAPKSSGGTQTAVATKLSTSPVSSGGSNGGRTVSQNSWFNSVQ